MKSIVLVVLAFVACAMAKPVDLRGQVGGAVGFATGVVAVPVLGLGGGAVGLATGGPEGALTQGAAGANAGVQLAQQVGGQKQKPSHNGHHNGDGDRGQSSSGGLFGLF